jgi:hypothetical protein
MYIPLLFLATLVEIVYRNVTTFFLFLFFSRIFGGFLKLLNF